MKERIEAKIEEIIESIIEKDAEEIGPNDYFILDMALKDIRAKEAQEESNRRLRETVAQLGFTPFGGFGA